jgi:nickel-dependent lactate racemase
MDTPKIMPKHHLSGRSGGDSNAYKGREDWIRTTVYVDPALKRLAKERGLKFTEVLNQALQALAKAEPTTNN